MSVAMSGKATVRPPRTAPLVPAVVLALCSLTVCACSTAALRFFFDGVPEPGGSAQQEEESGPTEPQEPIGPMPPAARGEMSVHRPYAEGKCAKCHASRFGKPEGISSIFQGVPMLLEPIDKLCFKCHEVEKKEYLHAPAISGQCVFCHDPHRMPYERLLLMKSTRDLCARCHSGSTFLTEKEHEKYGDRECIECHDPHAADFEFNLLPGVTRGEPEPRKPTVSLPDDW